MSETTFNARSRASYQRYSHLTVRFGDQDALGHVNNAAIAAYFEHARCEHLMPRLTSPDAPRLNIVLARIVIDYWKEIRFPNSIDIGAKVTRMGGKSFVITCGLFVGDTCAASADATIVFFDTATRRAAEPPVDVRARIAELM